MFDERSFDTRSLDTRSWFYSIVDAVVEFVTGLSFFIKTTAVKATMLAKQNVLRVRKEP
jgi:hypothetical protein